VKNFVAGSLCAMALVTITLAVYLGFGFMEVAADAPPSAWETGLMTPAVRASVRRRAPAMQNPLPISDATLAAGGKLYMNDCVGCHGAPEKPPSDFGLGFYPPAPQFPHNGSQYSAAELFWVAKHGIRMSGMYPQAPHYSDSQLWSLASFIGRIRNLPPAVAKAVLAPPAPPAGAPTAK
jgi:mono/diheme cytochrome c family protein